MPVRKDNSGKWRYRVLVRLPDGRRVRISGTPAINTKQHAEIAERAHIARTLGGPAEPEKEVPTFGEFATEFLETYVVTNNKASEQVAKKCIIELHLRPAFGTLKLDEIERREIDHFKVRVSNGRTPKTVNNILTVLGRILSYAVEAGLIDKAPRMRFVRVPPQPFDFLDDAELTRLLTAGQTDPTVLAALLMGVDAGLRAGEIRALHWEDVDLVAGNVVVRRSEYRGELQSPKGHRARVVPLTTRLKKALEAIQHDGPRVLIRPDGRPWTVEVMRTALPVVASRAKLRPIGWHALRHTFCSQLAVRGVPPKAIQELAGHMSLTTTMRYLHLAPRVLDDAIRVLESRGAWQQGGNDEEATSKSEEPN
jgi:integrase